MNSSILPASRSSAHSELNERVKPTAFRRVAGRLAGLAGRIQSGAAGGAQKVRQSLKPCHLHLATSVVVGASLATLYYRSQTSSNAFEKRVAKMAHNLQFLEKEANQARVSLFDLQSGQAAAEAEMKGIDRRLGPLEGGVARLRSDVMHLITQLKIRSQHDDTANKQHLEVLSSLGRPKTL